MEVYSEHVEMITANRRLFLLLIAVGLIAYVAWSAEDLDSLQQFGRRLMSHWHLLMGAVAAASLAFSNHMVVRLTGDALSLRAGASFRRVALGEISSARALAEIGQGHTQHSVLSMLGLHGGFMSQVVKTGVRLSFFDGKTLDFSSNNPDHLAAMIEQMAQQAVAGEPLQQAGKLPKLRL